MSGAADPRAPFASVEVGAHRISILKDGGQAYPAMLDAISSARSSICFETYILRDDFTGRRFAKALCERASSGVEVSLTYDAWGSSISAEFLRKLQKAGVRTLAFHPVRLSGRMGRVLSRLRRRNHRKLLVVDREIGFTGGLNVADDYAAKEDGGRGWRDTHVRIEGPGVKELLGLFLRTWQRHGGAPLDAERYVVAGRRPDPHVRILGNELRADRKEVRRAYLRAIHMARKRILITNAYFLPTYRVLGALRGAALRGVEISLILAGTTDVPAILLASRAIYGPMLRAGIRIFEWKGRVLHAKTAVIDGEWATIGSSNLDALSLRMNLEVNAVFEDVRLAAALESMFNQDLVYSEEVTLEAWLNRPMGERLGSWFAYLFHDWL